MGGSDPRKKQTTIIQGERGKLALSNKRKSVPLKVTVKDPNNSDNKNNDEEQVEQIVQIWLLVIKNSYSKFPHFGSFFCFQIST